MDSAKKQHERFLLDRFLELQGISPTSIQPLDPPDFLINLEGREVGIELTELYIKSDKSRVHPQPKEEPLLQTVETITNRIVSKAREIYCDVGNSPVLATIWFSDRITLDKKKGDQIAELIAHQIQSMSLLDSQKGSWRSSEDENEERPLSEWVAIIHAEGVPERFARWTVATPGFAVTLTPKHLQEAIGEKAKKISDYQKYAGTEEIWLLMVADRTRPSQRLFVTPDFPLDSVHSPFTKTFYCDYVHKEVIEITNRAKASEAKC
jgi:hypothetical protein